MGITVILESAIGLSFIFLLVSLLITSANELLSGMLGLRASTLRKGVETMLAGDASATDTVFKHPLINLMSRSTRRGPSYISGKNFAETLCDFISSAGSYAKLGSHYLQNFDLLGSISAAPLPEDVKKIVASFAVVSKSDIEAFKAKLGEWFDQTMERVSGWYSRTMRAISLLLGLVIAAAANIDTIAIVSTLTQDDAARTAIVGQALEYLKSNPPGQKPEEAGALNAELNTVLKKNVDGLLSGKLIGWGGGGRNSVVESGDTVPLAIVVLMKALGFLVTAIAGALGAPFWFDLLGRLVNMRSSLAIKT